MPSKKWRIPPAKRAAPSFLAAYGGKVSLRPGEPLPVHVSTKRTSWHVRAYRVGYYDGIGGALVATTEEFPGHKYDEPTFAPGTKAVTVNWPVGTNMDTSDWPEGLYIIQVVSRKDRTEFPIVVRSADATDKVAVIPSATTWQAYNNWGGRSLYIGPDNQFGTRSYAVNFQRPYSDRGLQQLYSMCVPMAQLADESRVPVAWFANTDISLNPDLLKGALGAASLGHDEYWTNTYRTAMESLRDNGGNLAFFGANACYWRVRVDPDTNGNPLVMTCYKDAGLDPVKGATTTARWRDDPKARAENAMIGQYYDAFPVTGALVIRDPDFFLFEGTGVTAGTQLNGLLGSEIDRYYPIDSTPRPIQVPALSPTASRGVGTWHTMTYYTTDSGAGVFSTGTMGWSRSLKYPTQPAGISDEARAFAHKVSLNVYAALSLRGLGKKHPATDDTADLPLPANNTTGAA